MRETAPWKRERLPTPVFCPGEFHGPYSPWGRKELDTTEWLSLACLLYRWGEWCTGRINDLSTVIPHIHNGAGIWTQKAWSYQPVMLLLYLVHTPVMSWTPLYFKYLLANLSLQLHVNALQAGCQLYLFLFWVLVAETTDSKCFGNNWPVSKQRKHENRLKWGC